MNNPTEKSRPLARAFVTGGTGFIGSALVNHLLEQGLRVRCLIHQTPLKISAPMMDTMQGNLSDFNWSELENFQPDVIFHFARMAGSNKQLRAQAAAENAEANTALIKWLEKQDNPPLLVFGSGTLVYGDQDSTPIDESAGLEPTGFQKEYVKAEEPILNALQQTKLPIIIVRPPWIYGAGSWFEWFFVKHMKEKKKVPLYGTGQNFMSLIHIKDCAGLIYHIAKYGMIGDCYNITGHAPVLQQQFALLLRKLSGLPIKKYSPVYLWIKMDRAAREALTFSLKLDTKHRTLTDSYALFHPELYAGLRSVLAQYDLPRGNPG